MLLPAHERRDEIRFYVAKRLPYGPRLKIAFGLMAVGLTLEIVFMYSMFWIGLPLVLAGVLMLLTKGFDNVVEQRWPSQEWRSARREEVEQIIALNKQQKQWDRDAVDITCTRGFFVFAAVMLVVALTALFVLPRWTPVGIMLMANPAIMVLPFWVTGVRHILKNDQIVIKATTFLEVERAFESIKKDTEEFQYQIQTAEAKDGSGDVPRDLKALVTFHDGSAEFLGVQMQIAINSVQGTDFPYFYCVLVARPEFGGLKVNEFRSLPKGIVLEPKRETDVDIMVIRQMTTKNSGYHTKPGDAVRIFGYAFIQARRLLAERT